MLGRRFLDSAIDFVVMKNGEKWIVLRPVVAIVIIRSTKRVYQSYFAMNFIKG